MSEVKHIVKAYDYDGKFYGYAAPHPDDPENKSFSYYVDDIKEAKLFNDFFEASRYVERFQDGSNLEYIISVYNPEDDNKSRKQKIKEIIEDFVKDEYGTNELDNPSWNIEELADTIDKNLD